MQRGATPEAQTYGAGRVRTSDFATRSVNGTALERRHRRVSRRGPSIGQHRPYVFQGKCRARVRRAMREQHPSSPIENDHPALLDDAQHAPEPEALVDLPRRVAVHGVRELESSLCKGGSLLPSRTDRNDLGTANSQSCPLPLQLSGVPEADRSAEGAQEEEDHRALVARIGDRGKRGMRARRKRDRVSHGGTNDLLAHRFTSPAATPARGGEGCRAPSSAARSRRARSSSG